MRFVRFFRVAEVVETFDPRRVFLETLDEFRYEVMQYRRRRWARQITGGWLDFVSMILLGRNWVIAIS